MRKVDRTEIPIPTALEGENCLNHLKQIINNPAEVKASGDLYKGKITNTDRSYINTVTIALKGLYKNKCAYCEKLCFYPRIEHFRPKGRVIGNQPLPNGYFWLCYEWTNLLPSCHECNSIEAKGDKFPIRGVRKYTFPLSGNPQNLCLIQNLYSSNYLTEEDPFYIHPEYCDDMWTHFDFDKNGKMIGVSDYGIKMVSDFKLDDEDRNGWRREIYDSHFTRLLRLIRRFKRNLNPISEDIFDEELDDIISEIVYNSEDEKLPYTLFRKSLRIKIDYFFIEPLDEVFRKEIKNKIAESLLKLI